MAEGGHPDFESYVVEATNGAVWIDRAIDVD